MLADQWSFDAHLNIVNFAPVINNAASFHNMVSIFVSILSLAEIEIILTMYVYFMVRFQNTVFNAKYDYIFILKRAQQQYFYNFLIHF